MINKIKNHRLRAIIFVLIFGIVIFGIYNQFYNINNIAEGNYIESLDSFNGEYTLKSYLIKGTSLSNNSIRVELINNLTKKTRNIYFNYSMQEAIMRWVNDDYVEINGIELNIYNDSYDWRKK